MWFIKPEKLSLLVFVVRIAFCWPQLNVDLYQSCFMDHLAPKYDIHQCYWCPVSLFNIFFMFWSLVTSNDLWHCRSTKEAKSLLTVINIQTLKFIENTQKEKLFKLKYLFRGALNNHLQSTSSILKFPFLPNTKNQTSKIADMHEGQKRHYSLAF